MRFSVGKNNRKKGIRKYTNFYATRMNENEGFTAPAGDEPGGKMIAHDVAEAGEVFQ